MSNYLAHHGRKGQKWGILNGPPYPLSGDNLANAKRQYSAEKKKKVKMTTVNHYGDKRKDDVAKKGGFDVVRAKNSASIDRHINKAIKNKKGSTLVKSKLQGDEYVYSKTSGVSEDYLKDLDIGIDKHTTSKKSILDSTLSEILNPYENKKILYMSKEYVDTILESPYLNDLSEDEARLYTKAKSFIEKNEKK